MAFFDELGKKISQTGQGVVQKTKDATEVLKLNGMISDEEKRINMLLLEIGKKYFDMHSESFEPEFDRVINEIKDAQSKIALYTEQVKRLKGVVRCPYCGGEVPYGAPFCNSCGAAMNTSAEAARQAVQNGKSCPVCGAVMPPNNAFCTNCGCEMGNEVDKQTVSAESNDSSSDLDSDSCLCPNCGKQLSRQALFCSGCGRKMEGA